MNSQKEIIKYINKFKENTGCDEKDIFIFHGRFSPLMLFASWFEPLLSLQTRYQQEMSFLAFSKNEDTIMIFSQEEYENFSRKVFKEYWDKKVSLSELQNDHILLYKKIDSLYKKNNFVNIKELSKKELFSLTSHIRSLYREVAAKTIYVEQFNKRIALDIINKQNLVNKVWKYIDDIPIETFETRRDKILLNILSRGPIDDTTIADVYFLFTDYWAPKKTIEIQSILKKKKIESLKINIQNKENKLSKKNNEYKKILSSLDNQTKYFLDYVQYIMQGRDKRKDPLAKIQYLIYLSISEIARRFQIEENYIPYITIDEVVDNNGFPPSKEELEKRVGGLYSFGNKNGKISIGTSEYDFFINEVNKNIKKFNNFNVSKIKGNIAFKGKIRGYVKIVIDPYKNKSFNNGDILVTSMTRPEFVPLMKKASAVITNEGGITCHAAIVSRELEIPCIIGTKFATQALNDGDFVEVDANNGVVNILKRAKVKTDE